MKVVISSTGKGLDSQVNMRFGRCPYFIIAEIENKDIMKVEAIENSMANQMQGAGISAGKIIAEKNVNAIITGNIGPRALDVLKQFNIKVYNGSGQVKEALQKFIDGKLEKIQ